MRLYVPTFRRVGQQLTLRSLPEPLRKDAVLVCPQEEADRHARSLPWVTILIQPEEIKTISQKRAWIIQQSQDDCLMMLDDDLEFHARGEGILSKRMATPEVVTKFFGELRGRIMGEYAHGGISPRFVNSLVKTDWKTNTRAMFALAFRTEVAQRELEFNRVRLREDMDYTLQLLRKGYPNIVGFDVCVSPKDYGAQGGCAAEGRTVELSNEEAERLAALHPGLVRVVEKAYKTSLPRKEVVVQWGKAYASSGKESGTGQVPRAVGAEDGG